MQRLAMVVMLAAAGCGRLGFDTSTDARSDATRLQLMQQLDVPATSNIWGAGHSTPPAPAGSGGGVLPTSVSLPAGTGRVLQITGATGSITYNGAAGFTSADGYDYGGPCASPPYGGISDVEVMRGQTLTAVVLDNTEPIDPAPPTGTQDPAALSITSIVLRQQFFVGDGLTGTGTGERQTFTLPDAATRLYFGFGDSEAVGGLPGSYVDNLGMVTIVIMIVGLAS